MKTPLLAIIVVVIFFTTGTNSKAEEHPIGIGTVLHHEGDSENGKIVTVESVVIDEEIGHMANLLVREVNNGKVIAQHTITAREGNTISIPFSIKPLGLGESGLVIMKWRVGEINADAVLFSLALDGKDPNKQAQPSNTI